MSAIAFNLVIVDALAHHPHGVWFQKVVRE